MLRVCVLSFLFSTIIFAQSNATDAALEGYVHDASGGPVQGARVTVTDLGTNVSANTTADADGYYRFPLLKIGAYRLETGASGFKSYTQNGINLSVGQKARIDIALEVGALTEVVEVTEDTPLADTGAAVVGAVLSTKEVEDLPIISRNIYNFHLLSPGVQGLPSSTFGTTQFTFGGTERSNWNLDGLDNTQRGGSRQLRMVITTPEAVEQMQVLANGYSAEFGRAAGGQVNVVLKSGTNDFHGSGLFLYRFKDLQARPSLAARNPDRTWRDEAFTIGGPILKNRLFFFGQFEDNPYTLPIAVSITAANAAALQLPASQTGNAPFGETYRTVVAKVNYKLNESNSGYVRYNRFTNHQPNNAGGLFIPDRGNNFDDHMNGGGVQLATIISPNLLNEVRGGVIRRTQANAPVGVPNSNGAYVNITGVANIGYDPLAKTETSEQSSQLIDNLTWTHGRSTWKAGVDVEHTSFDILRGQNRAFTFGGLAASNGRPAVSPLNQYLNTLANTIDPATGKPYTYTQFAEDGGDPKLQIAFNFLNLFLQDEFRITPRLTLNIGVRYEKIFFPSLDKNAPYPLSRKIDGDSTDIAPRFAFSWSPLASNKTVVKGSYGLYYDVPSLAIFYNAAQVNGSRFLSYQVNGSDPAAPVFPNVPSLTGSSFAVAPNINAFAPGFHNTYQHQANLQVQHEAFGNFLVTAGYNFAALRHGLYSENINLGAPVSYLADGRPVFGNRAAHPDQRFNQINLIESGGNTNYNAFFVNVTKRLSAGLEFAATYTWSHALGNTLGEGGAPQDPTNLARDYGNSDNDVRHYFVAQGLYEPRFNNSRIRWINGFEISGTAFYNSGYPINQTTGIDLNNDGNLNDRPLFVRRNAFRGPDIFQIDARLTRSFTIRERYRIMGIAEAENLLNSTNANCSTAGGCTGAVISTAGATDFGRITSARTARNFQLGAKFTF